MNYYGRNDITLGEFLQRYCFRTMYMCQSCDVEMAKHQRHFIHGTWELSVSMHTLPTSVSNANDGNVYTWLSCSKCSNVSVIVKLSRVVHDQVFQFCERICEHTKMTLFLFETNNLYCK